MPPLGPPKSAQGDTRARMVLDIDLNYPPIESHESEVSSGSRVPDQVYPQRTDPHTNPARWQQGFAPHTNPARWQQGFAPYADPARWHQGPAPHSNPARWHQSPAPHTNPARWHQGPAPHTNPTRWHQGSAPPLYDGINGSVINLEEIDDDVQIYSSWTRFPQARRHSVPPVTIVLDDDSEKDPINSGACLGAQGATRKGHNALAWPRCSAFREWDLLPCYLQTSTMVTEVQETWWLSAVSRIQIGKNAIIGRARMSWNLHQLHRATHHSFARYVCAKWFIHRQLFVAICSVIAA
ncbi:hypothetical protein Cni_G05321 [Canna indica]|uniref:Uncharacterized protein n=1 Tax=Canna indica TaxID=4628 RepID=A0AAQ3JWT4_9LILI|nr:hypothetical protein Cni_G05321 [Canna indica]